MKILGKTSLIVLLAVAFAVPAWAQDVDSEADRILRAMGDYLKGVDHFSFELEVVYDTFSDLGQELQYGGHVTASVRRPDGFRVRFDGDERRNQLVFDAGSMTMLDEKTNLYARAQLGTNIDAALDEIFERFGFSIPAADLIYSDPYAVLIENVEFGDYIGVHKVDRVPCHHLAFSQESIDWQIWIEAGPRPLPRRLVLTYKDEDGHPHYSTRLVNWNVDSGVSDHYFEFRPPAGARETELMAVQEGDEG